MRKVFAVPLLIASVSLAVAQEQERKLVDRLLKPDMALQNSAQGKQFLARRAKAQERAPVKSFHVSARSFDKHLPRARNLSAKEFPARRHASADSKARLLQRSALREGHAAYATPAASMARTAPESGRALGASEFAGNRPFLGRGKSQKALSARDTPLTIEQVRELLNKSE